MENRLTPLEDAFPRRTKPLLITGLVAGDPFLEATRDYMDVVVDGGADAVELIVPFSDPAYHGPVVRRACDRAMSERIGWEGVEEMIADFREEDEATPVIVSSYVNRILARGQQRCADELANAGVDAVRVTDLPAEEAGDFKEKIEQKGMSLIQTVAPSTAKKRFRRLEKEASGLLVWTGHCGTEVTMEREAFRERLKDLRQYTSLPIVASMNVESGEGAADIAEAAHGVLVESALAWLIEGMGANVEERLEVFVQDLRVHLDAVGEE